MADPATVTAANSPAGAPASADGSDGVQSDAKRPFQTIIMSDMHISDAEQRDERRPHWKAYKQRQYFFDDDFANLLKHIDETSDGPCELVLNGDIFDFDNVTALPPHPPGLVDWLSQLRGLHSEEWCSRFKIGRILADHEPWFRALREFIHKGHRAVFVVGNHDLELYWPTVQQHIREAMRLSDDAQDRLVFCEWFYVSGEDTFICHGHLFDPYCTIRDPIHPMVSMYGRPRVRIPFGDLAERYMLNGMGYFNPHATENFIMSLPEYIRFWFKYMLRDQPMLLFTWFWSAMVVLGTTLWTFWRPAMKDPLTIEEKVQSIANRSNATPSQVRMLNQIHAPSAATNPLQIAQELWLDRGVLFLVMMWAAFQLVAYINFFFVSIHWAWVLVPIALMFPLYLSYSFKVKSATFVEPLLTEERARLLHQIVGVKRVVFGHTHVPEHRDIGPVEFLNCGFWSPAFAEPECINRIGTQTFVWIRRDNGEESATVWEWPPGGTAPRAFDVDNPLPKSSLAPAEEAGVAA